MARLLVCAAALAACLLLVPVHGQNLEKKLMAACREGKYNDFTKVIAEMEKAVAKEISKRKPKDKSPMPKVEVDFFDDEVRRCVQRAVGGEARTGVAGRPVACLNGKG